jgi:GNAT superfamily N-acetyltransferase
MVEVIVAPEARKEDLWQLFLEYARELTQYDGEPRPETTRHYAYFDSYWQDAQRTAFLILYDHDPAGFCLFRDAGVCYRIDEFYIRPLHRRRGFGKVAVDHIKDHCRGLGRHKTLAANIYVNNAPAIAFWKSVGFKDTGRRVRIRSLRLIETEADLSE